jgi:hypothetical protein
MTLGVVSTQTLLRNALKRAAARLRGAGVPFALGGSYALWVHGAPESRHDVDLVIAEGARDQTATALGVGGFEIEEPPEQWLFKAHRKGACVDVLHRLNGVPVAPELIAAASVHDVLGVKIPVLPPSLIITVKLRALDEHNCDFSQLLPPVRALREQLDWTHIRADTTRNDFAVAFLVLVERLAIAPPQIPP